MDIDTAHGYKIMHMPCAYLYLRWNGARPWHTNVCLDSRTFGSSTVIPTSLAVVGTRYRSKSNGQPTGADSRGCSPKSQRACTETGDSNPFDRHPNQADANGIFFPFPLWSQRNWTARGFLSTLEMQTWLHKWKIAIKVSRHRLDRRREDELWAFDGGKQMTTWCNLCPGR
jgi:hypothetical protein